MIPMKARTLKLPRPYLLAALFFSTLFLIVAVPLVSFLHHPLPVPADSPEEVRLVIPKGSSLRGAARLLRENGLISSVEWFVAAGKILWMERHIKPGEYAFVPGDTPAGIMARLRSGDVVRYAVTIPEGFSLKQIAEQVARAELAGAGEFLRRATDPALASELGLPGKTLEGYVYPDSYFFTKDDGIDDILRAMVDRFEAVFTDEMKVRSAELGMSVHEVVTLASIIEKETGAAEERTLISSVFHNRIRKRIPLQSDPTVIYAIPDFDGNLTRRHLNEPSPYNTYRVRGLPPGPIASPGRDALMAALHPDETNYLYFVSKNDGTHHFSRTLAEHNRAVDRYQKKKVKESI